MLQPALTQLQIFENSFFVHVCKECSFKLHKKSLCHILSFTMIRFIYWLCCWSSVTDWAWINSVSWLLCCYHPIAVKSMFLFKGPVSFHTDKGYSCNFVVYGVFKYLIFIIFYLFNGFNSFSWRTNLVKTHCARWLIGDLQFIS